LKQRPARLHGDTEHIAEHRDPDLDPDACEKSD